MEGGIASRLTASPGPVARLSPARARLALTLIAACCALGLIQPAVSPPKRSGLRAEGDVALHSATIERIRSGEPYYDAVGGELRRREYPTASVFNWRTPLHFTVVGGLTADLAWALLVSLRVLLLVAGLYTLRLARPHAVERAIGILVLFGVFLSYPVSGVVMSEVWTGTLIGLSVYAYHHRLAHWGAGLAVLALFMRELAAPYWVVCAGLGVNGLLRGRGALLRRPRIGELAILGLGAAAYAVYYASHVLQVRAHAMPGAIAHTDSWVQFLGMPFLLATLRMNFWLMTDWLAVIFFALAVAGVAGGRLSPHVRWAVLAYLAFFAVVGQSFNNAWGFVSAAVWAFAATHGITGARRLIHAAWAEPAVSQATNTSDAPA